MDDIEVVQISGVRVSVMDDNEGYLVNDCLVLSADQVFALLKIFGVMGFDLTGHSSAEAAGYKIDIDKYLREEVLI